ncbi:MAG: hypothetical protein QF475_02545 [Candidatus Undinarchaeales archaeon]|jgi:uncharacterized protein (UPF0303 family)|nr:hypothetical protein [Candidatus Undinarchaeales archaeon]|tara:strand:+ start:107 stop:376 length:270 start_codon:yes stop_codon:yes gene_type:complete
MSKIEELNEKTYVFELREGMDGASAYDLAEDLRKFLKKERNWIVKDIHITGHQTYGTMYFLCSKEIKGHKADMLVEKVNGKVGTHIVMK